MQSFLSITEPLSSWLTFCKNIRFTAPTKALTEEFKTDCMVWMLFHGNNLSAGAANIEWRGEKWSLVNHFIPYTEDEVGSVKRFDSNFMQKYLAARKLSPASKNALKAAMPLWQAYLKEKDSHIVRERLRLNRPDVGWYQVRNALASRDGFDPASFAKFKTAYMALADKLRPQIYDFEILKE